MGIPDNAIGVMSYDNDNPLQYRYNDDNVHLYSVEVVSDNLIRCQYKSIGTAPSNASYLGAIVTQDRQVLWVNNSKPLP